MSTDTYTDAWLCPDCAEVKGEKFDPELTDNYDPETGDGFRDFSKTPCYLCQSPLAGYRYRFARWIQGAPRVGDKTVCPNHDGNFDCLAFCPVCEGNQEYEYTGFLPCQTCSVAVPDDVWREELGYCQPCQAQYFDGTEYENDAFIDTPTREDNN
jgi:hypothetical protein